LGFFPLKRGGAGASGKAMSVDIETVKKIARLSRIAIDDVEADKMVGELNGILAWVEQLGEVDVTGVEAMTSVTGHNARLREDVVTDGDVRDRVLANAPAKEGIFFGVPKVIE
jgi:aspartyl-tRNA(Asn)/glutamyl-tRNA(Gln) amidotransferase subunit C